MANVFPPNVVAAPGSRHFVPTGQPGPGLQAVRSTWRQPRQSLSEHWMQPGDASNQIAEIVESGVGYPTTPGSKGNFTRRVGGILMNPTVNPEDDQAFDTQVTDNRAYEPSRGRRGIKTIVRSGGQVGPDVQSTPDPFETGRVDIVARSGNQDPDGAEADEYVPVASAGQRASGVNGLSGSDVAISPLVLIGGAVLVWLMFAKPR